MKTPSTGFNHCIIKIDLPGQVLFQELTSEKLPFGAVPNTIALAQALVIPNSTDDPSGNDLIRIPDQALFPTHLVRTTSVKVEEKDFVIKTQLLAKGNAAADYRYKFIGLNKERTDEEMKSTLSGKFKNLLTLKDYSFEQLDSRDAVFSYSADFIVENELMYIGGLKAAKLPLFEVIFSLDDFPLEDRDHPLLYWKYESVDYYESIINYELPANSQIVELPENVDIANDYIHYSLRAEKTSPTTVKVTRTVTTTKQTIAPERYKDFRETIKKVVAAEDKYVVFK